MDKSLDTMLAFISALTEHYGAKEIPNQPKHRKFTNPWAAVGSSRSYFYIMQKTKQVRYGINSTTANILSERMFQSIAAKEQPVPSGKPVDASYEAVRT